MKLRDIFWLQASPWRDVRFFVVPRLLRLGHSALMLTLRISTTGVHRLKPFYDKTSETGMLFILWHDHTFVPLHVFRWRGIGTMMSTSRAGQMQAAFWRLYGWPIVWGSTRKRAGVSALREVAKRLRAGEMFGFTPDGPKGPRHQAHPGAVYLASKASAALLPVSVAASDFWQLGTWDKYLIPKPFARVHIHVGAPLQIPANLSREETEIWQKRVTLALEESHRIARAEVEKIAP